jgi:hypothetical protein
MMVGETSGFLRGFGSHCRDCLRSPKTQWAEFCPSSQLSNLAIKLHRMSLIPGAEYMSNCRFPLRRKNSMALKSFLSIWICFRNSFLLKYKSQMRFYFIAVESSQRTSRSSRNESSRSSVPVSILIPCNVCSNIQQVSSYSPSSTFGREPRPPAVVQTASSRIAL